MIYFFYQGEVKKYHKKHPYSGSDDDYNPGFRPRGCMSLKERFKFFKTEDEGLYPEIIEIGGLTFAVEICADHLHRQFANRVEARIYNKVDVQLLIADGISARDTRPANVSKLLFIKVEKRDCFPTLIGSVTATELESLTDSLSLIDEAKSVHEKSSTLTFYECVVPSHNLDDPIDEDHPDRTPIYC
jgi:hypothetical protein